MKKATEMTINGVRIGELKRYWVPVDWRTGRQIEKTRSKIYYSIRYSAAGESPIKESECNQREAPEVVQGYGLEGL